MRGHYTLVTLNNRKHLAGIYDSPTDMNIDWLTGPEMDYHAILTKQGPHRDGFHFSQGTEPGVSYMVHGSAVP